MSVAVSYTHLSTALFSPYRETQGRNSGALASTLDGSIIRDCYALNCSVSGYQAGGLVDVYQRQDK